MLDLYTRPLKDKVVRPFIDLLGNSVTPNTLTAVGFLLGLLVPICSATNHHVWAVAFWSSNRMLDGLDGAVARRYNSQTTFGGLFDIACDFTIYSLLPIGVAYSQSSRHNGDFFAVACLISAFHVNNVILFYLAAIPKPESESKQKELSSLNMMPALIEGTESLFLLTAMLIWPTYIDSLSWFMTGLVGINIVQRLYKARNL